MNATDKSNIGITSWLSLYWGKASYAGELDETGKPCGFGIVAYGDPKNNKSPIEYKGTFFNGVPHG